MQPCCNGYKCVIALSVVLLLISWHACANRAEEILGACVTLVSL